jgi:hypothetical protein
MSIYGALANLSNIFHSRLAQHRRDVLPPESLVLISVLWNLVIPGKVGIYRQYVSAHSFILLLVGGGLVIDHEINESVLLPPDGQRVDGVAIVGEPVTPHPVAENPLVSVIG